MSANYYNGPYDQTGATFYAPHAPHQRFPCPPYAYQVAANYYPDVSVNGGYYQPIPFQFNPYLQPYSTPVQLKTPAQIYAESWIGNDEFDRIKGQFDECKKKIKQLILVGCRPMQEDQSRVYSELLESRPNAQGRMLDGVYIQLEHLCNAQKRCDYYFSLLQQGEQPAVEMTEQSRAIVDLIKSFERLAEQWRGIQEWEREKLEKSRLSKDSPSAVNGSAGELQGSSGPRRLAIFEAITLRPEKDAVAVVAASDLSGSKFEHLESVTALVGEADQESEALLRLDLSQSFSCASNECAQDSETLGSVKNPFQFNTARLTWQGVEGLAPFSLFSDSAPSAST